jgi:DNA polymerase-3 subunit epsilon
MKEHVFAFIDTETTGLDPDRHELIEIGGLIVRASDPSDITTYEVIEEFEYKIKPERIQDANPQSLKVTQYEASKWTEGRTLAEVIQDVAVKTKDAVMVAHNVAFDSAFLEKAFRTTGITNTMHYHRLDTVSMAYAILRAKGEVDRLSLHALCEHFGVIQNGEHAALPDARSMFELYKKMMSM